MPTNANAYNSRVTDESLEKRFRDTFRAQGGAELVDDLYAQGVIVPVVDFTAAATGDTLATNLQTAWDFTTGFNTVQNTTTTIISNAGFWQLDLSLNESGASVANGIIAITDGFSSKTIWRARADGAVTVITDNPIVVFVRSGDSVTVQSTAASLDVNIWYRQIADVNGNLVNPSGFTSS